MERFELVELKGGGRSLRGAGGETFHPVVGPMAEAKRLHVEQQRLVERSKGLSPFVIWDVGLGAAANAIAVLEAMENSAAELHSFDLTHEPLKFALQHAQELGYPVPHVRTLEELLEKGSVRVGKVTWRFHLGDFHELLRTQMFPAPHAVLFDPYSPQTNPAMWSLENFRLLRARLSEPCLLTNYTRSTAVRVTLLLAGFYVGYGIGVGEKDQTTVASNDAALIENPLGRDWIERVRSSTNAAPLRNGLYGRGKIFAEDLEQLLRHPQLKEVLGNS